MIAVMLAACGDSGGNPEAALQPESSGSTALTLQTTTSSTSTTTTTTTTTTTQPPADDIRAGLVAELTERSGSAGVFGLEFTAADTECAADEMISSFGAARLAELGLTAEGVPADLSDHLQPGEARQIIEAVEACVDLRTQIVDQLVADEAFPFDRPVAECLTDSFLDDDTILDSVAAAALGTQEDADRATATIETAALGLLSSCL